MNGKFRVWSDVLKQYLNEGNWHIKMDCDGYLHVRNEYNHSVPGKLVAEFCTGLSAFKSYRGKRPEDLEIYEGDIVAGLSYGQRGLIAWRDGGFGFMYESKTQLQKELSNGEDWYDFVPFSGHSHLKEILDAFEIIGTIHEAKK